MNIKKTIWIAALMALFPFFLHAQGHFDWVKTYYGPQYNQDDVNRPISSVVDSDGNTYVLGQFTPGASIDNVELLPIAGENRICTLIAKFSASGNLVWHKALYSRKSIAQPYDIRNNGDSAITIMASFAMPYHGRFSDSSNVYFLDTMLIDADNNLMNTDSISDVHTTAFITLDLDGNLLERHFLQMAYVDSSGATLRLGRTTGDPSDNRIITSILSNELFNIDSHGNIYVCRRAVDIYSWYDRNDGEAVVSVQNGGISQLRIIVDGQKSLYYTPSYRSLHINQQILKFSPHFDTLIDAIYVFDSLNNIPEGRYTYISVTSFDKDDDDNFYLLLGGYDYLDSMRISRSNSLYCHSNSMVAFDACMIGYHSDLTVTRKVQLSSTPDLTNYKGYFFHGARYDNETNSIYLLGSVQKSPLGVDNPDCYILYNADTLDLQRNLFWLRLDPLSGGLLSYGKARTNFMTRDHDHDVGFPQSNIVVSNNRVFSQVCYQGDILFQDTSINIGTAGHGIGVMWWDTEGHEAGFIDYNAVSIKNRTGCLHIVDSILYLTGIVASDADFGTHHISSTGHDQAYIVCYTDTAFMTPYVYHDPRTQQHIDWEQNLTFTLTNTPITLTATASSGLPITYYCADTSIGKIEGQTLNLRQCGTTAVTATQEGTDYGFYPAAPVTKILSVGQVGIGNPDQQPLLVFPNPTQGDLFVNIPNERIADISIISASGQSMKPNLVGNRLSLASYPAGVYFLQVITENNKYHQKIIKL